MYHYAGNNPVKYVDPDGQIVETAWDVFSLVTGVASFVENVKEGNVKGAIIDGLGIVADAVAVAVPCVPGGAGAAIKAAKVASAVADVAGGVLTAQDGLANGDYLEAASGALQAVSGVSSLSKVTKAADTISDAGKSAKTCPNPYGKNGCPAHQKGINDVITDANSRGLNTATEYKFDTSGGHKNSRYADAVVFDKNGNVAEIHQVGRSTKSGLPVSRERKAIEDIKNSKDYNGAKIIFHAYDQ